eukprot:CAMPEP_0206207768 /NCGR_PEP_ID=MMETSP0166-20121206/15793_1 /ASSEMBLY_ACC=CAM_ASM_000260 /TAXON_ID=95228 /ORGANISM="Vannella robusta, Strain DIVA3 518/3/11/1/6" /LENGTH=295 /DNA_ID=CAMNT_0053628603 /DNA_START=134 /DNA_END=1019 /DNA_ORIENTATION=+
MKDNNKDLAFKIIDLMKQQGIKADTFTYSALIGFYCDNENSDAAVKIVQDIIATGNKPSIVLYNNLISSLLRNDKQQLAQDIVQQMESEDIQPSDHTHSIILQTYLKEQLEFGLQYFQINKEFHKDDPVSYTMIIQALCRERRIEEALSYFEEMKKAVRYVDVIPYFSILELLAKEPSETDRVIPLLEELIEAQLALDIKQYNVILKASIDRIDVAMRVFQMLKDQPDVRPTVATYTILIDYFSSNSQYKESEELLAEMTNDNIQMSVITLNSLVKGYAKDGQYDKAMDIIRQSP